MHYFFHNRIFQLVLVQIFLSCHTHYHWKLHSLDTEIDPKLTQKIVRRHHVVIPNLHVQRDRPLQQRIVLLVEALTLDHHHLCVKCINLGGEANARDIVAIDPQLTSTLTISSASAYSSGNTMRQLKLPSPVNERKCTSVDWAASALSSHLCRTWVMWLFRYGGRLLSNCEPGVWDGFKFDKVSYYFLHSYLNFSI